MQAIGHRYRPVVSRIDAAPSNSRPRDIGPVTPTLQSKNYVTIPPSGTKVQGEFPKFQLQRKDKNDGTQTILAPAKDGMDRRSRAGRSGFVRNDRTLGRWYTGSGPRRADRRLAAFVTVAHSRRTSVT